MIVSFCCCCYCILWTVYIFCPCRSHCKYFLPVHMLSVHFVYDFLCCAKLVSLVRFHLFILILFLSPWETDPRKHYLLFVSENVLPMICPRSFMVPCLVFKSWSHFALTSLIYMQLSSFPNTTCWRDCLFSIIYCCLLRQRLIGDRCVDLFLGSLFCYSVPSIYVCFFCQYHAVLITVPS